MSEGGSRKRSGAWWLLPIFTGIVGGLIMYFVLRGDSPGRAKNGLMLGAALTAVHFGLGFAGVFQPDGGEWGGMQMDGMMMEDEMMGGEQGMTGMMMEDEQGKEGAMMEDEVGAEWTMSDAEMGDTMMSDESMADEP